MPDADPGGENVKAETAPLRTGTTVRVRLAGCDDEWCTGLVILAGGTSVMLMLDGMVHAPGGVIIAGVLALIVDYDAETVTGLLGGEYQIEIGEA